MNPAQHILILLVRLYRMTLSPLQGFLFGPLARCRFTPTCSQYALESIRTHGALAGSWLAVKRICRCHPWGGSGDDPVPPPTRHRRKGLRCSAILSATVRVERPAPRRVTGPRLQQAPH